MFELSVDREFCAAHALVVQGERETLHGHNWRVRVTVGGESLDEDGLLVDFHQLENDLDEILAPFANANLNETPPFDRANPTAERVAQYIGEAMRPRLSQHVSLRSVRITEAPGCAAVYRPEPVARH